MTGYLLLVFEFRFIAIMRMNSLCEFIYFINSSVWKEKKSVLISLKDYNVLLLFGSRLWKTGFHGSLMPHRFPSDLWNSKEANCVFTFPRTFQREFNLVFRYEKLQIREIIKLKKKKIKIKNQTRLSFR